MVATPLVMLKGGCDNFYLNDHSISRWKPNKVNKITLKVEREKVARVCFEIDLN